MMSKKQRTRLEKLEKLASKDPMSELGSRFKLAKEQPSVRPPENHPWRTGYAARQK